MVKPGALEEEEFTVAPAAREGRGELHWRWGSRRRQGPQHVARNPQKERCPPAGVFFVLAHSYGLELEHV